MVRSRSSRGSKQQCKMTQPSPVWLLHIAQRLPHYRFVSILRNNATISCKRETRTSSASRHQSKVQNKDYTARQPLSLWYLKNLIIQTKTLCFALDKFFSFLNLLHRLDISSNFPIRNCLVPKSNFMLSCAGKMVDKLISKDFSRDAFLAHEALCCFLQTSAGMRVHVSGFLPSGVRYPC